MVEIELSPLKIYDVRRRDRKLGAGSFGIVFEVEWNGTTCAAKFMHDIFKEILSAEEKQAFITTFEKECATWSALRHPQIVQFLGIYFDPSHTPVMVLEKMDASLRSLLESTPKEDFPLINKVVILRQVAQGLVYLHSHSPKLVHHDLSPNNILVNEVTYLTKLTDFGMTRAIDAASLTRSSSIKGTPGFMPPEALRHPPQYDDKLDVFSYGNLIIMTVTHEWPTPVIPRPSRTEGEEMQGAVVYSQLDTRAPYLELFSEGEKKLFQGMVKLCLNDNADQRPTSNMLLPQMKQMEKTVLKSYSVQEQDSNVQLAMWRMQKDLENRDGEAVRVNRVNAQLVSQSSVADQKVKSLRERIENVELRLRLQGRTVPNLPMFDSSLHEMTAPTADEPSVTSTLLEPDELPDTRRPCQWCFRQGKCVCALFTVSQTLQHCALHCPVYCTLRLPYCMRDLSFCTTLGVSYSSIKELLHMHFLPLIVHFDHTLEGTINWANLYHPADK